LTIWHCILSAELAKTQSFRLLFWRFCPLGSKFRGSNYIFLMFFIKGISMRRRRTFEYLFKTNPQMQRWWMLLLIIIAITTIVDENKTKHIAIREIVRRAVFFGFVEW